MKILLSEFYDGIEGIYELDSFPAIIPNYKEYQIEFMMPGQDGKLIIAAFVKYENDIDFYKAWERICELTMATDILHL